MKKQHVRYVYFKRHNERLNYLNLENSLILCCFTLPVLRQKDRDRLDGLTKILISIIGSKEL